MFRMILRLKTKSDVETILNELTASLGFSTKAAVIRFAIGYSLEKEGDPRFEENESTKYNIKIQDGGEYNRYTIMGDDEIIYKAIFETHLGRKIDEEEFFPELLNAHLERGIHLLHSDYRIMKDKNKFLEKIMRGMQPDI